MEDAVSVRPGQTAVDTLWAVTAKGEQRRVVCGVTGVVGCSVIVMSVAASELVLLLAQEDVVA